MDWYKTKNILIFILIVLNITLFAVLIYELIGPALTKMALTKAGDIDPEGRKSARDEHAEKMALQKQQENN